MTETILTVLFQIISMVLLITVIYKLTYNNFIEYLDNRKKHVNDSIESAENDALSAAKLKEELLLDKNELKVSKIKTLEEAQLLGRQMGEEIISSSKDQARLLITKAHEEIEMDKKQAQSEISNEILDIVSLVSAKFISDNMSEEVQNELINQAIEAVNYEK